MQFKGCFIGKLLLSMMRGIESVAVFSLATSDVDATLGPVSGHTLEVPSVLADADELMVTVSLDVDLDVGRAQILLLTLAQHGTGPDGSVVPLNEAHHLGVAATSGTTSPDPVVPSVTTPAVLDKDALQHSSILVQLGVARSQGQDQAQETEGETKMHGHRLVMTTMASSGLLY